MAPAQMSGIRIPISTSRTIHGAASPPGRNPPETSGHACTRVCRADERHRGRGAERGAVEDVVEARVAQQHEQRDEHEQQSREREHDDAHERVTLGEEVEPGRPERSADVLEEQSQHHARRGTPTHREPDDEERLVLVHVDGVQVQQHEQGHQRRGDGERDREEPPERESHDRGEPQRQGDAEVGHVGVGQLGEQARHDVQRPHALAGSGGELAPAASSRRDRVLVERIAAAHAIRQRRDRAAALRARDVAVGRWVLGHGRGRARRLAT